MRDERLDVDVAGKPAVDQRRDALAAGFGPKGLFIKGVRAAVGLALDFWTWRRLAAEGMSDDDAAALMVAAVSTAAQPKE